MSHESRVSNTTALVFGDVSVLRYPNGDEVLGGHAFGVAWHLKGLQRAALLVSRVGGDAAGDDVIRALEAWHVPTVGVQRSAAQSTGMAYVRLGEDGSPTIVAEDDQAWDRISAVESLQALSTLGCTLIVHGTRCLRSASNRRTLDGLIAETGAPVYFDADSGLVSLGERELQRCFARSSWVSAQQGELPAIGRALGFASNRPERIARQFVEAFDIDAFFVTDDVRGAAAVTGAGELHRVVPAGELNVIDRVGVKEAFSAVVVCGLLEGWPVPETLRRAQAFVELLAALPAPGIPTLALYDDVRAQWADRAADFNTHERDGSTISAPAPIPEEALLPGQIEQADEALDDLRERRASARMRTSVASQAALAGDAEADEALARAERSVEKIDDRIAETERRLRALRRAAREHRSRGGVEELYPLIALDKVLGAKGVAADGELGEVRDVYVDEVSWDVRYLLVEAGAQSVERSVLIGVDEVSLPDWKGGSFRIDPDRQTLLASALPEALAPNLFPLQKISRFSVEAEGESCGWISDVVLDDREWVVRYLEIESRQLVLSRRTLVPIAWLKRIDWAQRNVIVGVSADAVASAPALEQSKLVSRDYELELFEHYGAYHDIGRSKGGN